MGDMQPVIAVEDDVIEFPGNDQRIIPHKNVSFKESDMAAAGDG